MVNGIHLEICNNFNNNSARSLTLIKRILNSHYCFNLCIVFICLPLSTYIYYEDINFIYKNKINEVHKEKFKMKNYFDYIERSKDCTIGRYLEKKKRIRNKS